MVKHTHYFDSYAHFLAPGCLAPYLDAFAAELATMGYTSLTIDSYLQSIAHFGGWMQSQSMTIEDIDAQVLSAFSAHRCTCPGSRRHAGISHRYVARVRRFVYYLGQRGVITLEEDHPAPVRPPALEEFCHWLRHHRGLAEPTIRRHERLVLQLLPLLGDDSTQYQAVTVRHVVYSEAKRHSPAQAKTVASTLRMYLRFLATQGRCRPGLDAAVPTVPQWHLSALPRYLVAEEVERVIVACDSRTPQGLRDRAILLLLARLGLRGGDIIAMRLDDIDWDEGTLSVCGKGRRDVRLPLPQEVGDALLAYLEQARPLVPLGHLFLCLQAPYRPFASSASIADVVRLALARAGIVDPPSRGAHLLRHSAATAMLRAGVTPDTIAAVLRHRSLDTTAYYAKVDSHLLSQITQPWPGVASC